MKKNSKYKLLGSLKLRTSFVLLVLVFVQPIFYLGYSQTQSASDAKKAKIIGQVTDENKETLIGATVTLVGTKSVVPTDVNGRFSIDAPENGQLKISYTGYENLVVNLNGRKTIEVSLVPSLKALDEVVVTAFGTQKKANVTGAISTVEGKQLLSIPAGNISNMLIGSATGISGLQLTGEPGNNSTNIYVRGLGTYNSTTPLVVIDGVEQASEQAFAEFNGIDANEIDGISILKDAASTAVYGIRGANGVIIVTTKRGQKGKPSIEYTMNYGVTRASALQETANSFEWATARNEGINILSKQLGNQSDNAYVFSQDQLWKFQNNRDYTEAEVAAMNLTDEQKAQLNASPALYYRNTDLSKLLFSGNGPQTQLNVKVSGGTDFVKYSTSVGYFNQRGIGPNINLGSMKTASAFERFNFRSNFDFNINKNTEIVLNLSGQFSTGSGPGAVSPTYGTTNPNNITQRYQTMTSLVIEGSPLAMANMMDGRLVTGVAGAGGSASNPLGLLNVNTSNPLTTILNAGIGWGNNSLLDNSIKFNHKMDYLTSGLAFHATANYQSDFRKYAFLDASFAQYSYRRNPTNPNQIDYFGGNFGGTTYNINPGFNSTWSKMYFDGSVDYNRTIGDHKVSGLVFAKASQYMMPGSFNVPSGIMGLGGRATYDFKERYLLELNVGYNGTEQFVKGQRFGFFPAASVGWVPTNESFFKENDWVSFFKIRASYGEVGNDQYGGRRYLYMPSTYSLNLGTINSFQGYYFGSGNGSAPDPYYKGAAEGALGNPVVTWERAQKLDIGIESRFLNDRLSIVADYFKDVRNNILTSSGIIPSVFGVGGGNVPPVNVGITENKGYEISVGWKDKIDEVGYSANFGVSYSKNNIVYRAEAPNPYEWMNATGHPIGQKFGYLSDGFFNTPEELANRVYNASTSNVATLGDIKYKDVNGDGRIDNKDIVPIGFSNLPQYHYNLRLGVNYKGFELSGLIIGTQNGSYYMNTGFTIPFQKIQGNLMKWFYEDRWTPEKVAAGLPINAPRVDMIATANSASYLVSDFWLKSTDFVRLKNVQISYTFQKSKLLKAAGMSSLRVYANADNIFTLKNALTKYGIDPESVDSGSAYLYPLTNIVNVGLSVKF